MWPALTCMVCTNMSIYISGIWIFGTHPVLSVHLLQEGSLDLVQEPIKIQTFSTTFGITGRMCICMH